jgi:ABC-2 type transport system permease protein
MFSLSLSHTGTMFRRISLQLLKDHRFLALSIVAPLLIVYFLKLFLDTLAGPFFSPTRYIMPIAAFLVHFLTYIMCAIVLVRERVAETLVRMFVNGFRRSEIIFGYICAYTILATVQALLVLTELYWLFSLDYDFGRLFSIFLVMWGLAVISIALGIFVSNFARNEGQVFPFIPVVIVPSVLLSGMLVAVEKLLEWVQWLSRVTPLYYANNVLQQIIKPNGSVWDEWGSVVGLAAYGVIIFLFANFTLKEQD